MSETVDASALRQIPWFNIKAIDGRRINLMPHWDGTKWNMYVFHQGTAIRMQIVEVDSGDYLSKTPQRPTDIRIPFAETMWQRASFPETTRFVTGILDDFANFSASVSKIQFFHRQRSQINSGALALYVSTELEYILSLCRSVFDLLQELISVLWKSFVKLHNAELESTRKARTMPSSFADIVIKNGTELVPQAEISAKWGLPEPLSQEYAQAAPLFRNLRRWRDHVVHSGGKMGPIFVDEGGFKVLTTHRLLEWADCWSEKEITETGVGRLEPWLAKVIFGSMDTCNQLIETFARIIQLPEPIAPGLMVFSRNPTDGALHETEAHLRCQESDDAGRCGRKTRVSSDNLMSDPSQPLSNRFLATAAAADFWTAG
jgi:hypothetical protein